MKVTVVGVKTGIYAGCIAHPVLLITSASGQGSVHWGRNRDLDEMLKHYIKGVFQPYETNIPQDRITFDSLSST